ncbi:hypothetical protein PIB30_015544 [Stylosanthes scabra]|uniref:Uncharacterized protein n=1 Tax=Stylosanthes scabra TaxID=79078 RepID=A0ABU6Z3P8_9FABA|nr:hypothetical protein [Stylosanthes scabra]
MCVTLGLGRCAFDKEVDNAARMAVETRHAHLLVVANRCSTIVSSYQRNLNHVFSIRLKALLRHVFTSPLGGPSVVPPRRCPCTSNVYLSSLCNSAHQSGAMEERKDIPLVFNDGVEIDVRRGAMKPMMWDAVLA